MILVTFIGYTRNILWWNSFRENFHQTLLPIFTLDLELLKEKKSLVEDSSREKLDIGRRCPPKGMPFYWIILEINGAAAASRKMILYRRLFFYLTLVNNLCSFSRWSGKKFDAYAFFLIEIRFVQLLKLKRGKDILIHRTCNSLNGIF